MSDKLQSHKKKTEKKSGESRKYAQIPYDSIIAAAETNGITGLNEDVAKQLAEDVSYRLREIIHKCSVHLRQNKRRKLSTADVNAVFETSEVPKIYGHVGAEEQLKSVYVKDANVFVPDEVEVQLASLALSDTVLSQKGEPFVKGSWISPSVPEDTTKPDELKPATSNSDKTDRLPPHLVSYYTNISKIILGNSEKLLQMVLRDLQTNSKIGPIVMYLLNLLSLGLSKLTRGGLGTVLRHRFLRTIDALTDNRFIEPNASVSVHQLLSMVLKCVLDPALLEGIAPKCNYELRDVAAQVLAKVVNSWCSLDTRVQLEVLQKLGSALLDGSGSLRSHYASLRSLCALGNEALDYCLWPHLEQYLAFLEMLKLQQTLKVAKMPGSVVQTQDTIEIEGAILDAAEMMYRKAWEQTTYNIAALDKLLEAYFGDSLCARRPYYHVTNVAREGVGTNGAAVEFETMATSAMKDAITSDFELDYRNWTAIAKIPPLFLANNRNLPTTRTSAQTLSSAFELLPLKHFSTIHFNFAGANPMSKMRLRRRVVDPLHAQMMCPSVYFTKSCQIGSIGKSLRRQHRTPATRSSLPGIMVTL